MPGQNRGETWAQSQASTLEESPWVDLGASFPSMGAAIKTTSPAMENHFLLMIFCNEEDVVAALLSLRRFRSHIQEEQGACRAAFPRARFVMARQELSWCNKKWTGIAAATKKKRRAHTTAPARAASPLAKGKRMSVVEF